MMRQVDFINMSDLSNNIFLTEPNYYEDVQCQFLVKSLQEKARTQKGKFENALSVYLDLTTNKPFMALNKMGNDDELRSDVKRLIEYKHLLDNPLEPYSAHRAYQESFIDSIQTNLVKKHGDNLLVGMLLFQQNAIKKRFNDYLHTLSKAIGKPDYFESDDFNFLSVEQNTMLFYGVSHLISDKEKFLQNYDIKQSFYNLLRDCDVELIEDFIHNPVKVWENIEKILPKALMKNSSSIQSLVDSAVAQLKSMSVTQYPPQMVKLLTNEINYDKYINQEMLPNLEAKASVISEPQNNPVNTPQNKVRM